MLRNMELVDLSPYRSPLLRFIDNFSPGISKKEARNAFMLQKVSDEQAIAWGALGGSLFVDKAWNVSAAVYLQSFSVAGQASAPQGVFFKPDGTKMYVTGYTSDKVIEYDIGTPWDVSTAGYLQNFSVAGQELSSHDLFFKPDGTKMYVVGTDSDNVNEYDLGTPWDVSTAGYLRLFSVGVNLTGMFIKPDGTKMYIIVFAQVSEYDLSTPWDVSTMVYLQNFSVAGQASTPQAVFFKPDGTKMYVTGYTSDKVSEYDLSIPWDVSTAVYLRDFNVAGQENSPRGLFFKPDGTKMYVTGTAGQDVNEYDLG